MSKVFIIAAVENNITENSPERENGWVAKPILPAESLPLRKLGWESQFPKTLKRRGGGENGHINFYDVLLQKDAR